MIASMTGFGREVAETGRERISAELRSVNNRGLKMSVRLPSELGGFQPEVEALVRSRVERGMVYVELDYRSLVPAMTYTVDADVLKLYAYEARTIKAALGIETPVELERLMSLPGVIAQKPIAEEEPAAVWARVRGVVERALASFAESRWREGAALAADLRARRAAIGGRLATVRARIPELTVAYRARFEERMRAFLERAGVALEPESVLREVAAYAERTDISEEVARLDAHLRELDRILDGMAMGAVGRQLEFLAQEMLREANTMGSKSQETGLVQDILAIKLEIDKIKEQVANAE